MIKLAWFEFVFDLILMFKNSKVEEIKVYSALILVLL